MCRTAKSVLILIGAALSFGHTIALAQIAPMPYTPVTAPSAESPTGGIQETSEKQPRAKILGWSHGGELAPTATDTKQEVDLDAGAEGVVFFFDAQAAGRKTRPIEYRYHLIGYDSDWSATENKIAHYRHLPPGQYRFEVQAHNPGQEWSSATAELSVKQRHFFYQTTYFYALLVLAMLALAFVLLRQRDQLLKGQIAMVLEERNRIASDCHDTLMAGFAAISWQLESTAKRLDDPDVRFQRAAKSCELARRIVTHCQAQARQIIWDLRDSDEITDILSHALSRALNATSSPELPDISFAVEGEEIPIAPTAVHHLVCISQEAVTNAIRHSGCSNIRIQLLYDSSSLNLTVRDDGRGFKYVDPGFRNSHFGIMVMQERSRKLGGAFNINTSPSMGTEISLKVGFREIHPLSDRQQHVVPWIGV